MNSLTPQRRSINVSNASQDPNESPNPHPSRLPPPHLAPHRHAGDKFWLMVAWSGGIKFNVWVPQVEYHLW